MATDTYTHKTISLPSNTIAHNWTPTNPNPPRAILILQHGFGEYAARYTVSHARLIPALTERNIDVWALDLQGHGRSPGEKGRGVVDVEQAVREHVWLCGYVVGIYSGGGRSDGDGIEGRTEGTIEQLTKNTTKANANAQHPPIFLFGHSLGGLVTAGSATTLLAAYRSPTTSTPDTAITTPAIPITGLILTSPVFPLPDLTIMERLKSLALHLLARPLAYLFPSREVPWPASPGGTLCGDKEEERRAAEDEVMFHGQISWTVAATAVGAVRGVWRGVRREVWGSTNGDKNGKEVDVLVLHGRGDCWTDWRGSSWFVEEIRKSRGGAGAGAGASVPEGEEGSGAKLVILESPYHELLNAGGSEGQEVLGQLLEWIDERI
ncbi:Alpha/Beta hydrolase protein [Aspergillus granulosus]|uniref:Alpha/Beta hydrolase protein n=1 Tax=Aspergillus granulosus TaxID=176169 RepID=A0ABR4GS22_9EURO